MDGRYLTRLLTEEEAAHCGALGLDVAYVEDAVWEEYLRHVGEDGIWQALWRTISNEQWMRRREKELMPLEAGRARDRTPQGRFSLRRAHGEALRGRLDASSSGGAWRGPPRSRVPLRVPAAWLQNRDLPPQWQDRAREILAKYRTDLAAEGMTVQGCCCGNEHQRLHDSTVIELQKAGFIEHDYESDVEDE